MLRDLKRRKELLFVYKPLPPKIKFWAPARGLGKNFVLQLLTWMRPVPLIVPTAASFFIQTNAVYIRNNLAEN